MLTLHVSVNGEKKAVDELRNIAGKAKDLRPAFKVARLLILESTQRNFMAGGRPERWEPLKASTLERRAREHMGSTWTATEKRSHSKMWIQRGANKGRITKGAAKYMAGAKPLRDTGMLMASIGFPSRDGISVNKPLELRVGTNVPYAWVHQKGWDEGKIPARPFMLLHPEDEEKIVKAILDHIAGDKP